MSSQSLHESFDRPDGITVGSERSFGIVFAVVFLLVALWPVISWQEPSYWALVVSALFAGISLTVPTLLQPLNVVWFRFGLLLHRIVSPLILAMLFFLTVTPIAFIYRLLRKNPLRLGFDRTSSSYWIIREPPGPPPDSMTKQF